MDRAFDSRFSDNLKRVQKDVSQMNKLITDQVCMVAEKTVGFKKKHKGRRRLPREVVDAIKNRKEAKVEYAMASKQGDADRTLETWNHYLECKKVAGVRKTIHKNSMNKRTCDKIANAGKNGSGLFWKEVRRNDYKSSISELVVNNIFITEKLQLIEEIEDHFRGLAKANSNSFNDEEDIIFVFEDEHIGMDHNYRSTCTLDYKQSSSDHNYPASNKSIPENYWDEDTGRKIEKKEVIEIAKHLKLNKSYSDDLIANEFIKYGGHGFWYCATILLNAIREREVVPEDWNKGNISLLHKGGVHYLLDNYRGITIMSCMGKLFSSIIRSRLDMMVEKNNMLGEIQNGFRKDRSTLDNLLILRNVIEKSKAENKNCFLSFIDLRKAYDRVWREGLWRSMANLGFGGKTLAMIKALYTNTQQRVCMDWGKQIGSIVTLDLNKVVSFPQFSLHCIS